VKATHLLTTAVLTVWMTLSATAFDKGVVKGKNINVRAQANVNSEVVTQLQNGQRVVVIDEIAAKNPGPKSPKRWYMIALPTGTPVWVSAAFVQDGKVSATRLNVRSGPGENFSVLGRINKGVAVSELRRQDKWLEIEAPEAVHGYVATFLVDVDRPAPAATSVSAITPSGPALPPEVPIVTEPVIAEPVPMPVTTVEVVDLPPTAVTAIDSPTPAPTFSGLTAVDPGTVVSETTVTVTTATQPEVRPNALLVAPDEPTAEAPENVTYNVINPDAPKKTWFGRWWQRVSTKKKPAPTKETAAGEGRFHAPPPAAEEGPPAVRDVTREGIVVRSWNIQAPSDWALKEVYTGRVVNYLWTTHTNIPWKELSGRTVRVTGEEAIDRRWKRTPVLRIETLKTIDDDGEG
jgi:hypothetical protein